MTVTKLEFVNRVLDSVGERRVTVTTGSLATLVLNCALVAIDEIATSANWTFLKQRLTPASWSTEQATVSSSTEPYSIEGAYHYDSTHLFYSPIQYVPPEEFGLLPLTSYIGGSYKPTIYTITSNNVLSFSPYPNDATARAAIIVEYYKVPTVPASDGSNFTEPDRFVRLIELRTSALFALKHIADRELHQAFNAEYLQLKNHLTLRDVGQPSGGYSMYRGARSRNIR